MDIKDRFRPNFPIFINRPFCKLKFLIPRSTLPSPHPPQGYKPSYAYVCRPSLFRGVYLHSEIKVSKFKNVRELNTHTLSHTHTHTYIHTHIHTHTYTHTHTHTKRKATWLLGRQKGGQKEPLWNGLGLLPKTQYAKALGSDSNKKATTQTDARAAGKTDITPHATTAS